VYYLKQCRKSGLTDEQIRTAVDAAIKVKNVPAENILAAINRQMEEQWTPGQDRRQGRLWMRLLTALLKGNQKGREVFKDESRQHTQRV
jgi:hypothetical protein